MKPLRHLRRIGRIDAAAVGRLCALLHPAPTPEMGGGMAEVVAPRPKRATRPRRPAPLVARGPEPAPPAPPPHQPERIDGPPLPSRRLPHTPCAYGDDEAFQRQLAAVAAGAGLVERIPFRDRRYDGGTMGGVVGEINL